MANSKPIHNKDHKGKITMANTAIFKEDGLVLNSEQCQNYSLLLIDIGKFDQEHNLETPPVIHLFAQTEKTELISTSM